MKARKAMKPKIKIPQDRKKKTAKWRRHDEQIHVFVKP